MRLIDADNYKGKVIASHCYSGVNKLIYIDDVPTVDVNNLIIAEFDKIRAEIIDTGAYEQEINGKTEFLKGITYCLNIIDERISELKG